MTRATLIGLLALVTILAGSPACRHFIKIPGGGDIRIGHESEPVGPIVNDETRSGASCGPERPPCRGGTRCFGNNGKAACMTEEAACEAAGCGGKLCEILESFPLKAVCH
ncbi:MAG: hypothetical protein ACE5FC_04305 [Myxococcota bacterium]